MFAAIALQAILPALLGRLTGLAGVPGLIDRLRHVERRVGPVELLASGGDFVVSQRRAMGGGGALHVGRTKADHGLADDQAGLVVVVSCQLDGGLDFLGLVAVDHGHHVPAVGLEALGGIVGKPALGLAVDGDAVVVVEDHQLAELLGAGQRADLVGDAFHQAAVTHEAVGVMVDHGVAGAVELSRQGLLGERHAHRVGQALAQRASGGLDARRVAELRVAGGLGVELAEVLQLFQVQVVTGEVQQRVEQHGAVAVGQHEAVAVGPLRVGRVVLENIVPQHFGNIGHAHGRAGVAGLGLLYGIHGQGTNGIGQFETGWHESAPRLRKMISNDGFDRRAGRAHGMISLSAPQVASGAV